MSDLPIRAAGAVAWRRGPGDGLEVLLIHRQRYDDWSFPKGKLDPGEQLVAAAVREVREETGVEVRLGPRLTRHSYPQLRSTGAVKQVTYWSARPLDGADTGAEGYKPNDEVDEVRWLDSAAAADTLTYERDVGVLQAFGQAVQRRAHRSNPLIVLRHGSATARKAWSGDDRDRPLSDDGLAQSRQLVPLLRAYGVDTVLSSDAQRCQQTVQPYAEALGLKVDPDERWSEAAAERAEVHSGLEGLLEDKRPIVLCTHRPVLPWVFEGLAMPKVKLAPGQALVVHRRKGDIVGTELLQP